MHKRPISLAKLRTVPQQFSWIDPRLVRERSIDQLSHAACTLDLLLVTVADAQGLRYYADPSLCQHVSMTGPELHQARQTLITQGLVAYQRPLYQVFALEAAPPRGLPAPHAHGDGGRTCGQEGCMRAYLGGVRMIDYHRFCQIKDLHTLQGLNASQIAKAVVLDRHTVAYWLTQDHFRPRQPRQHVSTRDPFKPEIVRLLERHPSAATQVFQRLREHGFDGSYGLVKTSVHTVRPTRQPTVLKLALAPGECAQVDWGMFGSVPVGQTHRQLSFFVMVLCYSRMLYVECTVSQTMEHFLACHQHAFDFFGGMPHNIMVDNLTSAVLKRTIGDAPVLNPTYVDFATHHGFTITPCNVGKGNEKGRVANGVGSVKKHCLAGWENSDFRALNPAARHWRDPVAKARLHGETRAQPTV